MQLLGPIPRMLADSVVASAALLLANEGCTGELGHAILRVNSEWLSVQAVPRRVCQCPAACECKLRNWVEFSSSVDGSHVAKWFECLAWLHLDLDRKALDGCTQLSPEMALLPPLS